MHAFRIIVDVVSALVCMTREQVLGKGRTGMLCIARHVIAWLVRNLFGLSYPETALALRWGDHTTALHACRQVEVSIRAGKGARLDLLMATIGELAEAA